MSEKETPANQTQVLALAKRIESIEGMLCHLDSQGYSNSVTLDGTGSKVKELEQKIDLLLSLLIPKEVKEEE